MRKDKKKSSDSVTAITNEVVEQNCFGPPKNPSKREQRYMNRHDTTQAPTATSSTNHDELPSSSPTSAPPWRGKVLKLLRSSSKKKGKTPVKQKAKKAKKRVVKQKLGYKKLGYKASKAKPIAKGSMHCNPNASLVESNNRIFSRSIIDLSYWALVVNTLHWCIIDEKKKFPRDIPSTPACVEPDVFFCFRVCCLMFFIDM